MATFDINQPYVQEVIRMGAAQGYNPMQIAGILGRTGVESGYQTNGPPGDNGTAFGAQQWRGPRKLALMDTASKMNLPWTDPKVQATHLFNELSSTEKASGEALRTATTPEDIQNVVSGYERPQGYTPENPRGALGYDKALANANEIAKAIGTGQGAGEGGAFGSSDGTAPISGQMSDMSKATPSGQDSGGDLGSSLLGVSAALAARDNPNQAAQMRALMTKEGKSQVIGFNPDHSGVITYDPTTNTTTTVPVSGGIVGKGKATQAAQGPSHILGDNGQPLVGQALLEKLSPEDKSQVEAYIEGRLVLPPGRGVGSPETVRMRSLITQVDPSFEQGNAAARAAVAKSYGSGKIADTFGALNTVAGHLNDLAIANQGLSNGQIKPLNWIKNTYSSSTGGTAPSNFTTASNLVAEEMTKAYRGAGGAEADVKALRDQLSENNSPEQNQVILGQLAHMVQSKLQATQDQIDNTMGPVASQKYRIITPRAKEQFDSVIQQGQDALKKTQGSGAAPSPTGGAATTPMVGAKQAPDGNWYLPDPNRPGKYLMVK